MFYNSLNCFDTTARRKPFEGFFGSTFFLRQSLNSNCKYVVDKIEGPPTSFNSVRDKPLLVLWIKAALLRPYDYRLSFLRKRAITDDGKL